MWNLVPMSAWKNTANLLFGPFIVQTSNNTYQIIVGSSRVDLDLKFSECSGHVVTGGEIFRGGNYAWPLSSYSKLGRTYYLCAKGIASWGLHFFRNIGGGELY